MNQVSAIQAPKREDYEPHVRVFAPWAEGEELSIRASLLLTRDRALATKKFCCEAAWPVLDHVERMAGRFAFQTMAFDDLKQLRYILTMLVAQASNLEALFAPELPLEGSGARG